MQRPAFLLLILIAMGLLVSPARPGTPLALTVTPLHALGATPVAEGGTPAPAALPMEPPAPKVSEAVQKFLDERDAFAQASQYSDALKSADRALAVARDAKDAVGEAMAQVARAHVLGWLQRTEEALAAWQQAAVQWERVGDGPGQITALTEVALLQVKGTSETLNPFAAQVVAIARAEAKRPRAALEALLSAGFRCYVEWRMGEARELWLALLTLQEKLDPNPRKVANILNLLGSVTRWQGDLAGAKEFHQRALTLKEKLTDSYGMAASLNDLGVVARLQGNLTDARQFYQRAVTIFEKRASSWYMELANSLDNLGRVAELQGDLTGAKEFYQRALTLKEKWHPDPSVALSLTQGLGRVMLAQGDVAGAKEFYHRVLPLYEERAPNSLEMALVLGGLGGVASRRGDVAGAKEFYQRALAIQEKLAPNSPDVAASLNNLGSVASQQGELAGAKEYNQRALAIQEKLGPNSLAVASSVNNLGSVAAKQGNWAEAERHARRAWEIVRHQSAAVTGDEARQAFGSSTAFYAANLLRAQLALGKADAALVTLEESRAQALQQLLVEQGLTERLVKPELWRAHQQALAAQNRAGKRLEQAGAAEAKAQVDLQAQEAQEADAATLAAKRLALSEAREQVEQAQAEYTRARVDAEQRWVEVKQSTPLAFPKPLDAGQSRQALAPGTLFLAFAVGEEESTLFLVRSDGPVAACSLKLPLKELTARVEFVRQSVAGDAGGRPVKPAGAEEVRLEAARTLFQKLFPPETRQAIAGARRLVLSPDGVLWELPFAALVTNESGAPRYLGLEKPLTYAQSLTLYAYSRRAPAAPGGAKLTALVVGNPLYDPDRRAELLAAQRARPLKPSGKPSVQVAKRGEGELAVLSRDGTIPVPLPQAEVEAAAVAKLYGTRSASGLEPTESWFRQQAGQAHLIHLATHGYFNPFRAMSSGVRLAVPEKSPTAEETAKDGALQAWEFMTDAGLGLKAELVVLSACDTGRGQNVRSEGIVGLTRALQYAGARSIVASQWQVADESTKRLMVAFHEKLRAGQAKDEALREAMRRVQQNPVTAHPYHWAPFFLIGDPENHGLRAARTETAPGTPRPLSRPRGRLLDK